MSAEREVALGKSHLAVLPESEDLVVVDPLGFEIFLLGLQVLYIKRLVKEAVQEESKFRDLDKVGQLSFGKVVKHLRNNFCEISHLLVKIFEFLFVAHFWLH